MCHLWQISCFRLKCSTADCSTNNQTNIVQVVTRKLENITITSRLHCLWGPPTGLSKYTNLLQSGLKLGELTAWSSVVNGATSHRNATNTRISHKCRIIIIQMAVKILLTTVFYHLLNVLQCTINTVIFIIWPLTTIADLLDSEVFKSMW